MCLFVNLKSIYENVKTIKKKKELICVVKSDCYGLNSKKIIPILQLLGVEFLAYNTYLEYLKDKDLIIKYKFNVLIFESINKTMVNEDYENIHFTINSKNDLKYVKKNTLVQIQIDCGMNRAGIKEKSEFLYVIKNLEKMAKITGVYTHFTSDKIDQQFIREKAFFQNMIKGFKFPMIHAISTRMIDYDFGTHFRIGLAMYGYSDVLKLKKAISLITQNFTLRKVQKNEGVGYNQTFKTKKKGYILVIPYGYNEIEGIDHVMIKHQYFPIVAKRCMNHSFVFLNRKINNHSKIQILVKNDIIGNEKYNWYQILTSLKKMPKNYLWSEFYDISTILKKSKRKNQKYLIRTIRNQNFNLRTKWT